jgi:hypothetical protein
MFHASQPIRKRRRPRECQDASPGKKVGEKIWKAEAKAADEKAKKTAKVA